MKNIFKIAGVFVLGAALMGCAGNMPQAAGFSDGQAVVEEFKQNGFVIEDVENVDDHEVAFKVAADNGGANVRVSTFDSITDAIEAYDNIKAALTQSDYYMLSENEDGKGSMAQFYNSINYNNAIAVLDANSQTVIVVREIAQSNMDSVYQALEMYGYSVK